MFVGSALAGPRYYPTIVSIVVTIILNSILFSFPKKKTVNLAGQSLLWMREILASLSLASFNLEVLAALAILLVSVEL